MKKPHLVIFNPDQWRGDALGHMGHPAAQTPHLDQAAQSEFVSFDSAFCQNPVCTPSRCSFMTGWYPHVRGHRAMHHMLHDEWNEPCLLKILKDNSYFVWWGGKNDLVPGQGGFEPYCDIKYRPSGPQRPMFANDRQKEWRGEPDSDSFYSFYVGELDKGDAAIYLDNDWVNVLGAIAQIKAHAQSGSDQPLCLYLPLTYPHPPYAVEQPWFGLIERAQLPPRVPAPDDWDAALKPSLLKGICQRQNLEGWSEERWDELRAVYLGMCARVDHQFGLVCDALRQAGMWDDTAFFLFSDHGDFTGDYGLVEKTQNTFEDCLSRVPFLVKPPRGVAVQPRVSGALVELVDFAATVYDLTGIEPGYTHFGRSLRAVLAGAETHRDAVFCEGGRLPDETQAMERGSSSAFDTNGLYWPRTSLQIADGPEHGKAIMCRTKTHKYVRRLLESDELYDLQSDPHEQHNRINDPALAEVLSQLKDRLLTHYQQTCDVVPMQEDKR